MRIKDIIVYTFVLLLVISCTNKKIKKRYYCDMNNIYISVSEGDKYDSLIIGDTDSIIIRKTNGYYGEILLYFITGTDTIYVDNLYKNIYRIHPHSFSYKTIRRDEALDVLDSFPMKGRNIGIVGNGAEYYSFSAEKNGRYVKDLEIIK